MAEAINKKSEELQYSLQRLRSEYLKLMQACLSGSIYRDPSQAPFGSSLYDVHLREYGLDWPKYAQTMIGEKRLANLRSLTESVIIENVPGDLIETGVWRGGACILMRAVLFAHNIIDRNIWVADSFKGFPIGNELQYPADAGSDFHTYEKLAVSLEEVKENFHIYGLLDEQTKFLEGWFKDTLPTAPIGRLALMRLDGDMYESTMDALVSLYPKLSLQGYVIIDDYHVVPACKAAVNDYCSMNRITPEIIEIDGVGVYWKKSDVAERNNKNVVSNQAVTAPEMQISRISEAIIELNRSVIVRLNRSLTERDSDIFKLNQLLAERDVLAARLNQSLTERDAAVVKSNSELAALHSSVSWRITKPMRVFKKFISTLYPNSVTLEIGKTDLNQLIFQPLAPSEVSPKLNLEDNSHIKANTKKSHIYEYEIDLSSDTAAAKVIRMVGHNKRVLEIGAGPGSITKVLKQKNGCRVTGVEIDSSAIAKLSQFCEAVYQYDLNKPDWALNLSKCGTFDVIVAADVFEHLYDPKSTLIALKPFFSPDGYLVISLPHVGNNAVIASMLDSDFEYLDYGLLDRTHIRFFGISNMQRFIDKSGYKILSAEFVITPPEYTELAAHWKKIPATIKAALARNQYGSIYQVVMKVAPAEFRMEGIKLVELAVPEFTTTPMGLFRSWFGPYLNQKIHRFFLRWAL